MVFIRISVLSRLLCAAAVLALPVLAATPAQGQFFTGFSNTRIATAGDMATGGKLNPRIAQLPGLNFSTLGLFGDAEVFGQFSFPRPFIFALPDFSGAGLDFTETSFNEYLTLVANSYRIADTDTYKNSFLFTNSFSITNNRNFFGFYDDLQGAFDLFQADLGAFLNANPQLTVNERIRFATDPTALPSDLNDAAFNRIHGADFLAGGGFPGFGAPFTPTGTVGDSSVPLPGPLTPPGDADDSGTGSGSTDTAGISEFAAAIAPVDDGLDDGSPGDGDTEFLAAASASQAQPTPAANVSVVPEPATLGLLAMGGFALLGRSRRG